MINFRFASEWNSGGPESERPILLAAILVFNHRVERNLRRGRQISCDLCAQHKSAVIMRAGQRYRPHRRIAHPFAEGIEIIRGPATRWREVEFAVICSAQRLPEYLEAGRLPQIVSAFWRGGRRQHDGGHLPIEPELRLTPLRCGGYRSCDSADRAEVAGVMEHERLHCPALPLRFHPRKPLPVAPPPC